MLFRSQFVGEVLEKSGALELPKHSTLMHPNDYTTRQDLHCVYAVSDTHLDVYKRQQDIRLRAEVSVRWPR